MQIGLWRFFSFVVVVGLLVVVVLAVEEEDFVVAVAVAAAAVLVSGGGSIGEACFVCLFVCFCLLKKNLNLLPTIKEVDELMMNGLVGREWQ